MSRKTFVEPHLTHSPGDIRDIMASRPIRGEATLTFELGVNADPRQGTSDRTPLARVSVVAPNFNVLLLGMTSTHSHPDFVVSGFMGINDTMTEEQIREIVLHAPVEQKVKGKTKLFRFNLVVPMTVDGHKEVFRAAVDASTPDVALWALMQVTKPEAITGYIDALLAQFRAEHMASRQARPVQNH